MPEPAQVRLRLAVTRRSEARQSAFALPMPVTAASACSDVSLRLACEDLGLRPLRHRLKLRLGALAPTALCINIPDWREVAAVVADYLAVRACVARVLHVECRAVHAPLACLARHVVCCLSDHRQRPVGEAPLRRDDAVDLVRCLAAAESASVLL